MQYLANVNIPTTQEMLKTLDHKALNPPLSACSDYTAVKRQPPNVWTTNQRVVLAWLASHGNSWADIARVFNACFEDELPTARGLSQVAISSMGYSMQLSEDEEAALAALSSVNTSSKSAGFEALTRILVTRSAENLGITLVERDPGTPPRTTKLMRLSSIPYTKRKAGDIDVLTPDEESSPSSPIQGSKSHNRSHTGKKQASNPYLRTPAKTHYQNPSNTYPTPAPSDKPTKRAKYVAQIPSTCSNDQRRLDSTASKRLAALGFRAFNAASHTPYNAAKGFRAGLFKHTIHIPRVPDCQSHLYMEYANTHVEKGSTDPSPFISCTKNPMRAIFLAMKLGEDAQVAVIDIREADLSGNVMKSKALQLQPRGAYVAAGEYLIWSEVKPNAIISIVPIASLKKSLRAIKTPDDDDPFSVDILEKESFLYNARSAIQSRSRDTVLSYNLGTAIGQFVRALGLSPIYLSDAVWSICQDWKWSGEGGLGDHGKGNWRSNSALLEGTRDGYENKQPALSSLEYEDTASDGVGYTNIGEESSQNQAEVHEQKLQEGDDSDNGSALADDFVDQLHEAVAHATPDEREGYTNLPFRNVLDVPEIKLGEFVSENDGHVFESPVRRLEETREEGLEAEAMYRDSWTGM